MLDFPKPARQDSPSEPAGSQEGAVNKARQPVRWTRLILWIFGLALLAAAVAAMWSIFLSPVGVQVSQLESNVPVQVFGLGTVEARVTSNVGFKIPGVLIELRADVGDRIGKGGVLARLDDREQQAIVAKARAGTEQAEASLQAATANVQKAQATYANARNMNQRQQTLIRSSNTSIEAAQTAQTNEAAALAEVNFANSNVLVAQAAISNARASQQQEEVTMDFHTLTAPYGAMVIARKKELGSALSAGEPVFTLIDPETVWVLAYVDESRAGELAVGAPVEIVLRSLPGQRFAGRLARIQPESDRVNEERRVEIAFDHLAETPNLGEQAEVTITTVRLPQALLVPEAAIEGLGNSRGTVWTVEAGRLQRREVTLGHRLLDGRYEITAGMPDGAAAVTRLRSGLRVGRTAEIAAGRSS